MKVAVDMEVAMVVVEGDMEVIVLDMEVTAVVMEVVVVDMEVAVVVDVILEMKRTHSAVALLLPVLMETLLSRLKGAAATMVHVVTMVRVVIAVLVSAMKKLVMENVPGGHMNAGVALGAEVNSNVRGLVAGIGELRVMKLHR
jgi:hypothetical protein